MDPVCEEKINFLQKYVPFLANLIELLANDSGKEGKLAQMQLLYNLLNKPDNSVKIETLEKCEEVLSRVFGNADEKSKNDAKSCEETKTNASPLDQTTDKDSSVEGGGGLLEKTNGHSDAADNSTPLTDSLESENITSDNVLQCFPEEISTDINSKEISTDDQKIAECSPEKQEAACEAEENREDTENSPKADLNPEHLAPDKVEITEDKTNEKDISSEIEDTANNETVPEETTQTHVDEDLKNENHEEEGDERIKANDPGHDEVKLEVSEDEILVEAMEGKPCSPTSETNISEATEQIGVFVPNPTESLPFKIISAESLATSSDLKLLEHIHLEKEPEEPIKTAKDEKKTDPLDLLHPANSAETPVENLIIQPYESTNLTLPDSKTDNDEDDDDVLLIETRSSPICLDSDPDDEESIKQPLSVITVPVKVLPEVPKPPQPVPQKSKPIARKSTSMVKPINHQTLLNKKTVCHRKTKNLERAFIVKKDPKLLMETISLIDSDSDEDVQKSKNKVKEQNDNDVIIIGSSAQQNKAVPAKTAFTTKQSKMLPSKLHQKHSPKPPTAQSNFLNAVNLQPAPETSPSLGSAKRVAIPNAVHKNSPYSRVAPTAQPGCKSEPASIDLNTESVSAPQENDGMLKEWLECFLKNFASPLQVASHACFVLLQRVLKYRFFQRLKVTRLVLNMRAKNSEPGKMDLQMLLDLRNMFLQSGTLTEAGRRFCRFATNEAFGKPVALTTDAKTGKVTCRTRIVPSATCPDEVTQTPIRATSSTQTSQVIPLQKVSTSSSPAPSVLASSTPIGSNSNSTKRMKKIRKLSDGGAESGDDNDYTPYMTDLVLEDEVVSERKKSLRTNRTKRKEAGFTYSEDHDDEEFEALAKKIEDKKREELRLAEERELEKEQEKERKVKKTVAKKTTSKRQTSVVVEVETDTPKEPVRKKLRLADAEILGTAEDDLLTPTWVEADGDDNDDEVDSLLDFAEPPPSPENHSMETDCHIVEDSANANEEDSNDSETYPPSLDVGTNKQLKNIRRTHHTQCKKFDFCVHCRKRVPRIVHHYVNEHRSAEVFTSRLRTRSIRRLLTTSNVGFVHLYKGNQQQYAAHCIFCDKEVKFLLPYWYEHFTMHTGEYTFKCSGCNIRKPTRSLLANHLQSGSGCPKKGKAIRLYTFDTKSNQIEAHICTVCNYIQLHRKNVVRHLQTQHDIETVTSGHIIRVVLLQVSGPYRDEETIKNDESQLSLLQLSDDEEISINGELDGSSLMLQNDFTDNDDLSFMICGMLDVQTNLSATGSILGNEEETNSVDNK